MAPHVLELKRQMAGNHLVCSQRKYAGSAFGCYTDGAGSSVVTLGLLRSRAAEPGEFWSQHSHGPNITAEVKSWVINIFCMSTFLILLEQCRFSTSVLQHYHLIYFIKHRLYDY